MHSSLAWIEWLDRLDRVLQSARTDLVAFSRTGSELRIAALERSRRQLAVLLEQLQSLDPSILMADAERARDDLLARLQRTLDTVLLRLSGVSNRDIVESETQREHLLRTIDEALREGAYEATHLLAPDRLSA